MYGHSSWAMVQCKKSIAPQLAHHRMSLRAGAIIDPDARSIFFYILYSNTHVYLDSVKASVNHILMFCRKFTFSHEIYILHCHFFDHVQNYLISHLILMQSFNHPRMPLLSQRFHNLNQVQHFRIWSLFIF